METEELRARILEVLAECQPCSFEDLIALLGWEGDLRPLRKVIAELVREGVLAKEPDYERRKLLYKIKS